MTLDQDNTAIPLTPFEALAERVITQHEAARERQEHENKAKQEVERQASERRRQATAERAAIIQAKGEHILRHWLPNLFPLMSQVIVVEKEILHYRDTRLYYLFTFTIDDQEFLIATRGTFNTEEMVTPHTDRQWLVEHIGNVQAEPIPVRAGCPTFEDQVILEISCEITDRRIAGVKDRSEARKVTEENQEGQQS